MRIAELARSVGVRRFIFASSCSNYGASGDNFLDERAAFNPVTPYGESKVKVEQAVLPMAGDNFSPTFLRASTAYGVSPRLRFDLVVNNLTAWAFTTGKVHIKSDGTPWRPLVHVEDIARAYIAALEAPIDLVHDKAFNVGQTSENYQNSRRGRDGRSYRAQLPTSSSRRAAARTSAVIAWTAICCRARCMSSSRSGQWSAESSSSMMPT